MRILRIALPLCLIAALTACAAGAGSGKSYYFIDRKDAGNDATTAGCHVEYLTSSCAGTALSVRGDSCEGEQKQSINEYTNNSACHIHDNRTSPVDISTLNCAEQCGSRGGKCVTVANACTAGAITADSARCQCN